MTSWGAGLLTDQLWADDVLLPHRPYATDDLSRGQYRHSREDALLMRYVEHSPHALLGSIVIDCDHGDAAMRAFEMPREHPTPNWVAQSPSGRAHIGWWLSSPVCRTDSARLQPLRFAQRVEAGLRVCVGGDFSYGGQLTKNPIHPHWETIYGPAEPYELKDLVTIHTPRQMPRRPDRVAGLGRNVAMFDQARKWAYPQWWHHRHGTATEWEQLVLRHCHWVNTLFEAGVGGSLPFTEVQATARSIARWIWRNFDEVTYRARQAELGRRRAAQSSAQEARQAGGKAVSKAKQEAARRNAAKGGKVMSEAKREANRKRATKVDLAELMEVAL